MQESCAAHGEKYEGVKGHTVVTGAACFIESHLTDRLLDDGHTDDGIDSCEDYCLRAINERNLEGARTNPAFTLYKASRLELAAETGPGGPGCGGASGSALAALPRGCAGVFLDGAGSRTGDLANIRDVIEAA